MSIKLVRRVPSLIFLLACACSPDANRKDVPDTEATSALRTQYNSLPPGAIIRVEVDAERREIASSASMRLDEQGAVKDESDAAQVERAFTSGVEPAAVISNANAEELAKASSAISWHDWRAASNFAIYQPRVYLREGKGAYWNYATPSRSFSGSYRYYYYRRPICNSYCQPGYSGSFPAISSEPGIPGNAPLEIDAALAAAFQHYGVEPLYEQDFLISSPAEVELGRVLFFDKLLSGNRDTSCATCHIPELAGTDGVSLDATLQVRSGRQTPATIKQSLRPRNILPLFNRGHKSFTAMFWESTVALDPATGGFRSPAGNALPPGLSSALAVQALFPIASPDEMLGRAGQNELANAGENNFIGIWRGVLRRVLEVPQYRQLIAAAYPGITPDQISVALLGNAMAAFQSATWRSDNAPFDRYLKGDLSALSPQQKFGATLFYGKGHCASCHSGPLQTDHLHYNVVLPQFGPGPAPDLRDFIDLGLGRVTQRSVDNLKFRTPSLRNVKLTGPWGHNGAYNSLRAYVQHYTSPVEANLAWNISQVALPFTVPAPALLGAHQDHGLRALLAATSDVPPISLNEAEIDAIVAFFDALTEERFVGQGL